MKPFADRHRSPDGLEQILFAHHFALVPGEDFENPHDFWLDALGAAVVLDSIGLEVDPSVAELKRAEVKRL